ncbi:hypothetical protein [Actinomadura parmotrematis]|uniref:DUF4383 domain-containing protein n=1 Tax=Actinomadura parmotrematis TaxID=2864039 RepID=A0ABS7G337_9ACTN|nr:hypothetical protein [Actinomadura parmotrematis]MBW8486881.1 hypothetical protein [Actinomadura parmotrematis]
MNGTTAARYGAYAVGTVLMGIGAYGIVAHVPDLFGWAVWFAGGAVLHDAVFAPAVLLVGAVVTRRPVLQGALAVGGVLTLVALPMVLRLGARPDNPSILPLHYGWNLLIVLAVVAAVAAVVWWRRR